jgi:hypothetical protein
VNAWKTGPHETVGPKIATMKSARNTRSYKTRLNPYALPKPVAPKGKGRRVIFKKCVSFMFVFVLICDRSQILKLLTCRF